MNTVNDRKLVGGMISSIGFSQQDFASIKYIFFYLSNGLKEISFESDDDFCLVLTDSKRIKVQVKINTLTIPFARELSKNISYTDQNIIIGSSYDDSFRNVLQYKDRHLNNLSGEFYDDKGKLYSDWEMYCQGINIDSTFLLNCDFDIIDGVNQFAIARDAISQWAEKQKLIIDVNTLINELKSVISDKRCKCGHLSITEIQDIIFKHRNTRIELYNNTADLRLVTEVIEEIIRNNPFFEKEILPIKYSIENHHYVEARSRIEKCLFNHILEADLTRLYLWILNVLGEHSYIISLKSKYYLNDMFCYLEFAKAYYNLKEWIEARACLNEIDKKVWDENIFFLSALIYHDSIQDNEAQQELLKCLELNDSFIDALIMLGTLTSISNPDEAIKSFEKALLIDENCSAAYYGLAVLSENAFDFESALNYYNDYATKCTDEISSEIMAKIAAFSFICNKDHWELLFQKWNMLFRKQKQASREEAVLMPVIGWKQSYIFLLISKTDGFTIICGDTTIFEYQEGKNEARSSIGLVLPHIGFSMHKFVNENSFNPVRASDRYNMEEAALPAIIRDYTSLEGYNETLSKLLKTGKLHLNHEFGNNSKEYIINDDDITIEMKITGSELIGNIIIGDVLMRVWIDPIGNGFRSFKKQLSRDCSFNEACIVMKCNNHESTLTFKKKVIHIIYCD